MRFSLVADPSSKNHAGAELGAVGAEPREMSSGAVAETSGSRRRASDDAGATTSRVAAIRSLQVRAVGTSFLRARPVVVAPVAALNAILLGLSGASVEHRLALGGALGGALLLFTIERWWVGRHPIRERWLATSLLCTVALLALGCALSGGLSSPLLPIVIAPVVISAAGFGRSWLTVATNSIAFLLVGSLAFVPVDAPFAAIPDPWHRAMTVTSFGGLLALCYAGVAGLVGAYVRTGELLERMRVATLEEAAGRMRATEQVGAKLAHELKNPLAAIKALLQILRDRVDEKGTKRLDVALGEVDRMDGIVRDYLSFARPLADLELAPVELRGLADDVVGVLADRAQLAKVALVATGAACTITGDSRRLREALFNLADNAIAATPAGGSIEIAVAAVGNGARLHVEDTGIGIPPELVNAPAFTTTRPDGTGLGLTIARGAVTQHGGELHFSSRPGGGTIATIVLPSEPGSPLPAEAIMDGQEGSAK